MSSSLRPPLLRSRRFKHSSSVSTDSSDSSFSVGSQRGTGVSGLLPIPTGCSSPPILSLSHSDSGSGASLLFSSSSTSSGPIPQSGAISAPCSLGASGFSALVSGLSESSGEPSGSSSSAVLGSLAASAFDASGLAPAGSALGAPGSTGSDLAATKYVPSDEIGIPLEDSSAEFSFIAELHKMSSSRAGSSASSISEFPAYQPTGPILSIAAAVAASTLADAAAAGAPGQMLPTEYISTDTMDTLTKSMDLDSFDNFEDQDSMLGLL